MSDQFYALFFEDVESGIADIAEDDFAIGPVMMKGNCFVIHLLVQQMGTFTAETVAFYSNRGTVTGFIGDTLDLLMTSELCTSEFSH